MLSVSITILTVIMVLVSILMILIILMQRPKQEGLGAAFGGGALDQALGAHTTDILQKGTTWLAVVFFACSIFLAVFKTRELAGRDNVDVLQGVNREQLPPTEPPSLTELPPTTPPAEEGGPTPKVDDGAGAPVNPDGDTKTPSDPAEKPGSAEKKPDAAEKKSGAEEGKPANEKDQ